MRIPPGTLLDAIEAADPWEEDRELIAMSTFLAVRALRDQGVPKKEIARRLGIDRRTVRKYIRRLDRGETEPKRVLRGPAKLDPFRGVIEEKVASGLSAVQVFQDLGAREDFDASYPTVRRLVQRLRAVEPEVYCRMRFRPGEEAQIDFGEVGRVPHGDRLVRVWLYVMTLCYSRLAYYELVLDQTVPTFLGATARAFGFFGGVPERVKPDNLRAAVLIGQMGERYYQEDFFRFCRHHGTVPDAARVATPTDKGRVERDIQYAKGSCFRGRDFASLEEMRAHLRRWRAEVADVRVHGTTQRRPRDVFEAEERGALRPLPAELYELCRFGRYRVRKDCHVQVEGNFYSVPWRLVGTKVLVRLSETRVRAHDGGALVADHARAEGRGHTVTDPSHYPPTKRISTQEVHRRRVLELRGAGPRVAEMLSRLRESPVVYGDELARLARLLELHGAGALDRACHRALHFGVADGGRSVERILERGLHLRPLPEGTTVATSGAGDFPRPLAEYGRLLVAGEVA